MSRILFLDIDGVICHSKCKSKNPWGWNLDQECITQLNRLTDITESQIVISSSWRVIHPLNELADFLKCHGVKAEVLGATPTAVKEGNLYVAKGRGYEILEWLGTSGEDYIVVDDDSFDIIKVIPSNKFIHVMGGWYNGGLKKHHVDKYFQQHGFIDYRMFYEKS